MSLTDTEEVTPVNAPPGDVTIGELGRWLNRVDKQLATLVEKVDEQRGEYVHRTEWDARVTDVDRRVGALEHALAAKADRDAVLSKADKEAVASVGRALDELKAALQQRSPQWTAIAAVVVAACSLGLTLLQIVP